MHIATSGGQRSPHKQAPTRPRLAWVTNLAAPYRLPVWHGLEQYADLRVFLLESARRLATDQGTNRGADWAPSTQLDFTELPTYKLARGEARYYVATRPWRDDPASADAVLLGGWESPAYWQILASAKVRRTPTVAFYESTLASQSHSTGPVARARSTFYRSIDRIVVPGPAAQEAILAMGVSPDRVLVGFNAIDTSAFANVIAVPHAGHRFLYIGQLIERKQVDRIISAFAQICHPDDRLRIIGRGPLRDELVSQATALGVTDQLEWIEFVPNAELGSHMAESDSLVLASSEEVWGLVVNEALAAGLRVAVTRQCGVVPSIEGMQGVYIADSPQEIARAMRTARDAGDGGGHVHDPEILQHTPARFADTFWQAFTEAMALHGHDATPTNDKTGSDD